MYRNILVINLMHLGDLLLVTPILRTLRTNYPSSRLTLLADKKLADIVKDNPHIDECLLIDKKGADNNLPAFIRYIKKIRRHNFDLVINLQRNERASALAAFSGAKKIIGYSKPLFSILFTEVMENKKAVMHQIHSHFEVLTRGKIIDTLDDGGLEMTIPPNEAAAAEKFWSENFNDEDKVIALNIGASWLTKRWLDSYFAECADNLLARGYHIAFLGGPMDIEIVESSVAQMKHKDSPRLHILTGKMSLGMLAGLIRRMILMISTDSGPMHVGVAMNIPIVTMFGASPVPGFYPYDAKDILVKTPVNCHPCGLHQCPKTGDDNLGCMKKMPPSVIMSCVDKLLERFNEQPAYLLPSHYGAYDCQIIDMALANRDN